MTIDEIGIAAVELFKRGYDTFDIATLLRVKESIVCHAMNIVKEVA